MEQQSMFRALRHKDYQLYWGGQLVSLIGTWMQSVGQSWLVLELTHSPLKLGIISSLQFTPTLLLSLISGVWIDILPKRKVIIIAQTVLMICAFILFGLAVTGVVRYWHIAVLALVLGVAQTFDMPARQAFVVEMVGKEDLANAIALNSAMFNASRMLGPAVAGMVVAGVGAAWAFFINGLSFLVVIGAFFLMKIKSETRPIPRNISSELVEGVKYVANTPQVSSAILLLALISLFAINPNVLIPPFARDVLHGGAKGLGYMMSSYGLGALFGALMLARINGNTASRKMIHLGAGILCISEIIIIGIHTYWAAASVIFFTGWAQIAFTASTNTSVQSIVPNALRGRVMSIYALAFTGVTPVGSLLIGWVADRFGVPGAFCFGGSAGLASLLLVRQFVMRKRPKLSH